jgi:putative ABC transport system permease protein
MRAWSRIRTAFRALFRKRELDVEMEEEMRCHVEMRVQQNIAAGMNPEEARHAAARQFGWAESIKETCRDQRGVAWLEDLIQDVRFSARQLRRNPGFTAASVLTLALGVGANTAVFSIIDAVLLRPLAYPAAEQLVSLWERWPQAGIEQELVSGPNYLDWVRQNSVFSNLSAVAGWDGSGNFNLVLRETTAKVRANYVSSSVFSTLGITPMFGRTFLPEEDRKEGNRVAVLSYALWQRYFAGSSNVLGQKLTLDSYGRRDYTIVGVMPPGFGAPSPSELWLPIGWMGVTMDERRSAHWYNVIARLKPGVTLERARNEMDTIQARLKQAYPGESIGSAVAIVPLLDQALGRDLRRALWVLWGVVGGVLLIACANVANLLLGRAAARQKEIAVRLALGAGRGRVVRQLLAESVLLALVGGATGALLAWAGVQLFKGTAPANFPRLSEVGLNPAGLWFTLGVSVLTGVLFGVAPAWQCSRPDLNSGLKEGTRGASAGVPTNRMQNALVVAEVALAVLLLAGAGLMLQSFAQMLRANRGFQSEHLLTAELDFSVSGFSTWVRPTATRPQVPLKSLLDQLRALPGVEAAGAGSQFLRRENGPPRSSLTIFGRPALRPEDQPKADFTGISPEWLQALGAHVVRGRDVTEADALQAPGAVLINETLARRYFPNENPVGQRLKIGTDRPPLGATNVWGLPEWSTIVGVVSDVKSLSPHPTAVPEVYQSYWQFPMQSPTVLIRTTGAPSLLGSAVQRETKGLIPNLPVPPIHTMDELLADALAQSRLQTGLLSLFAAVALGLASVGLYGVLAYAVTQRTHEIGIRMALGAQRRDVLAHVIGRGMKLAVLGAGIGMAAALALTRVMSALLYQVKPTDPWTLAGVSALLMVVALLACWLPGRRAAQVQPIVALRTE